MKRTLFALLTVLTIASCSEETPVVLNQADTFSRQLIGTWEVEKVDVASTNGKSASISVGKESACNELSSTFDSKDVVSKFCIQFNDDKIKVSKFYTCSLAPEQLSWKLALDNTADKSVNWVSGNGFNITEINAGEIQATYKLAFFNLNSNSPDGDVVTESTTNQLWLDVNYDSKESSHSYKLRLKRIN